MRTPHAVLTALVLATAAPPAAACLNGTLEVTDDSIKAVRAATVKLDEGEPGPARLAIRVFLEKLGGIGVRLPKVGKDTDGRHALANKVYRVMALSTIRLDAALYTDRDGTVHEEARRAGLEEARDTLKELAAAKPDDPERQSDLGEALERSAPAEAKKTLEALAKKDLVVTPYALAALARLRAKDGDSKGRDEAIRACKKATKKELICDPSSKHQSS